MYNQGSCLQNMCSYIHVSSVCIININTNNMFHKKSRGTSCLTVIQMISLIRNISTNDVKCHLFCLQSMDIIKTLI